MGMHTEACYIGDTSTEIGGDVVIHDQNTLHSPDLIGDLQVSYLDSVLQKVSLQVWLGRGRAGGGGSNRTDKLSSRKVVALHFMN